MREEIKSLINTDPLPTLLYWNSILNYFEFNRPNLELDDIKALNDESERCRVFFNTDREVVETIYKNGKYLDVLTIVRSLDIAPEDVNPNIKYYYEQMLKIEQQNITKKLAQQVADMPPDNTPVEKWAHDLALDLCQFGD